MELPIEWLPAQGRPEQLILLLHGWRSDARALMPLAQALRSAFRKRPCWRLIRRSASNVRPTLSATRKTVRDATSDAISGACGTRSRT